MVPGMSNAPPSSIFQREHLRHAARDGLLIICTCRQCRHEEAYVAADLLLVHGDMPVESFGRADCGRCGGRACVRARSQMAVVHDMGKLDLVRPVGWSKSWEWRRAKLELPIAPLPEDIDRPKTSGQLTQASAPPAPPKFEDWTRPKGWAPRR